MLCVCVLDVMDVVFSICIVMRGAEDARVWESLSLSFLLSHCINFL